MKEYKYMFQNRNSGVKSTITEMKNNKHLAHKSSQFIVALLKLQQLEVHLFFVIYSLFKV